MIGDRAKFRTFSPERLQRCKCTSMTAIGELPRTIKTVLRDERPSSLTLIRPGGLPEGSVLTDHVEDVVDNLEEQAKVLCIATNRFSHFALLGL